MTLHTSAKCALELSGGGIEEGLGGFVLGVVCMSMSRRAYGLAAHSRRKSSRKVTPQHFLGTVAVAGLVLGCAWTVYSNVFGANIYPAVNSAAFEAPLVKNSTVVAERPRPSFNEIFASLSEQRPLISALEPASPSLMFNERFAASAPQGEPSRAVEATKLADASPLVAAPKAVELPNSRKRRSRRRRLSSH